MPGKPVAHRKLRRSWNEPGHAHELTFSCYRRSPLLSKDLPRSWFIAALDRARHRWNFALWAYVIMPEHAHVLLYPRQPGYQISSILKSIKQPVSQHATCSTRPSILLPVASPESPSVSSPAGCHADGPSRRHAILPPIAWRSRRLRTIPLQTGYHQNL